MKSTVRLLTLGIVFVGVVGTLGELLLLPKTAEESQSLRVQSFTFSPQVKLDQWQSLPSTPLQVSGDRLPETFVAAQVYHYRQDQRLLDIQMVYTIETNGNLVNFLKEYTSIFPAIIYSPKAEHRFDDRSGHYVIFQDQTRAYLASCINPRGKSTVTLEQFQRNRYLYDMTPDRILQWLFKSQSIRDFRCLWANLSMPLSGEEPAQTVSQLESVWFHWNRWWQEHFPQP